MLHLLLPKPSPPRFHRRPSRSQPPLPLSPLLLQEKKRMKGTRSWQSSRLEKHWHAYMCKRFKTGWIFLIFDLRVWIAYHFFQRWLTFSKVAKDELWPLRISLILTLSHVGHNSWGKGADSQTSFLVKFLSPSLFSTVQVFQKCTVKDVGVENLIEPTTRIEPQIRELRSGALLPHREKKVKYVLSCSNPANCLPLPTVWYNWWLCLNTSTLAPLLSLERNL